MTPRISCVWEAQAKLGESPLWVEPEQALYWVDIKAPAIHRYQPESGMTASWPLSEKIGCLVHAPQRGFLAALQSGFADLRLGEPGTAPGINHIANPEADLPGNRFNDGKLDARGRFWAGTMDDAERRRSGNWWQLSPCGSVCKIDDGYKVTNGPAFDPVRERVYLTDSADQTIYMARMLKDGGIADKQLFRRFGDGDGYPDGMTTDASGNLWVAFWDGACIRVFTPEARLVKEIAMPVPRPTSLAFAGTEDRLFVTSARTGLSPHALASAPLSGGLFRIDFE